MGTYCIYSGGRNGYGFYDEDPQFPQDCKKSIESLYVTQHIAGPSSANADKRCYRFAPLLDGYLFSVIYKDCTCDGESRTFFSSVNWFFTAEEADTFFNRNFVKHVYVLIAGSDEILREKGYTIPDWELTSTRDDGQPTENAQKALLSAAYFAAKAAFETNKLQAQVFLGCDTENGLFSSLFWLIRTYPPHMRKYLSFHIGGAAASETQAVALAIFRDAVLSSIVSLGRYDGAMAVRKIPLTEDRFPSSAFLPSVAEHYLALSAQEKQQIHSLFRESDHCLGFWQYIDAYCKHDTAALQGTALVKALGERAFLKALEAGSISDEEALALYDDSKQLSHMPQAVAALTARAKPFAEERKRREQERLQKQAAEQAARASAGNRRKKKTGNNKKKKATPAVADTPAEKKPRRERIPLRQQAASVRRVCLFLLPVLAAFLLTVGMGCAAYFFGIHTIAALPAATACWVYAAQIGGLLLLALPLGYLLISRVKKAVLKIQEKATTDEEETP